MSAKIKARESNALDSSSKDLGDLFPLPLTSMEKFHWLDNSKQFPNQSFCRFKFLGVIDSTAANLAAQHVIERHPLLRCKISNENGTLAWYLIPNFTREINWHATHQNQSNKIEFGSDEIGHWNIECRTDGDETEIWFILSHVLGDGLAGIQIANDWLKYYHQFSTGESQKFYRLNASDLNNRNRLGFLRKSYLKHVWKQPIGLFGATKFIFRRPAELSKASRDSNEWNVNEQPAVHGIWVDQDITDKLKAKSIEYKVANNSVLAGVLMQTLDNICQANLKRRSKWIRLILPMNIRTFADRRMTATNRTTIVQIDRQASDFHRKDFFQSLDQEIGIIREWELGKLFLLAVRLMGVNRGVLSRSAKSTKCRGTSVFANLGEPFSRLGLPIENGQTRIGELLLKDFDFAGPIRHKMPINFTCQKHLGRLRISLHSDPRILTDKEALEILDQFVGALRNFVQQQ